MYLVGQPHPNKERALLLLERVALDKVRLVTDAEVLQEILHRYAAIDRKEAIAPAFDALLGLVDEVFPISQRTVEAAKGILLARAGISARDAVHVAAMAEHKCEKIMSFDKGFDGIPGLSRLM